MLLDQNQIEEFDERGYLFLPECFTPDEAKLLRKEAKAVYALERKEVWRESSGVARTAFAAHLYNEGFRLLGAHPRLINPVMQILKGPAYIHQYMVNA